MLNILMSVLDMKHIQLYYIKHPKHGSSRILHYNTRIYKHKMIANCPKFDLNINVLFFPV